MSTIISNSVSFPRLPYDDVKTAVLGARYELSLNFVGETRARRINQESRGKSYVPNVLSFPLDKNLGEIYITPAVAKREAKKWRHSYQKHVLFLFIHGLLHLKGHDHGEKMEALEQNLLSKFSGK